MNGISMDSTKILTEKLSLARELATLKPELEHLRSQVSCHQTILSEKLALQRQVSTLEVELETEKRASKRAAQKIDNSAREGEYQQQMEELRKDLARERREMEKARKEVEKDLNDSDTRRTVLESRMDQMRTKLRTTREELKECQNELSQSRVAVVMGSSASTSGEALARNPRKRGALEMSTDDAIGTPDGVAVRKKRPAVKRGRNDQTMLGEKSMFSITPYLNRTVNIDRAPDSPGQEKEPEVAENENAETQAKEASKSRDEEEAIEHPLDDTKPTSSFPKVPAKRKNGKKVGQIERDVLAEGRAGSTNKKPGPKKSQTINTLEKVTEEDVDENQQPDSVIDLSTGDATKPVAPKTSKVQLKNNEPDEVEPKKKKRKLLGGGETIFDEEDGEAMKRPAKVALGPPRLLGKGGLLAPKGGPKGTFGVGNAFGAFSPLKKDRRGIGASFLA
jgi:hypothetical protein